jgi:hypothetical protein
VFIVSSMRRLIVFSFSKQKKVLIKRLGKKKFQNTKFNNETSDLYIQIEDRILKQIFHSICSSTG